MDNLTLRQLRYFDALARCRQFGHAADVCAVSQPALSVQIAKMEQTLGQKLFERGPRHVRLTIFGADLVPRVREILRAVDALGDLARTAQDGRLVRLRLGVIPTIAPYLLPALLARLHDTHGGIDIHVRETVTSRLLQELDDGRIDAAIVALPIDEPGLSEVHLFDEPLLLVRPQGQADGPAPDAEGLAKMRLLLLEEGHCFRDQALSFCNMAAAGRGEGLDGSSLSTLVQMVGAGIGATLIPQMAVTVEVKSAPVTATRFAPPEPTRVIGMVWRKGSAIASHLHALSETVRDVGRAGAELAAAMVDQPARESVGAAERQT